MLPQRAAYEEAHHFWVDGVLGRPAPQGRQELARGREPREWRFPHEQSPFRGDRTTTVATPLKIRSLLSASHDVAQVLREWSQAWHRAICLYDEG